MKILPIYDSTNTPRHQAWLTTSDITAGDTPGTYTLNDSDAAAMLGYASEIIVMDMPGTILFWDSDNQIAYDWTASE